MPFLGQNILPILLVFMLSFFPVLQAQIDFSTAHEDKNMTAIRVDQGSINVDGKLDERVWDLAEPATGFVQSDPHSGQPASERTEVRILYDEDNLYVGAWCFDSGGREGLVITDISRDFYTLDTDVIQVIFDTFNDDRNGMGFATNPVGSRRDIQVGADGDSMNRNWDGFWYVKTSITDEGWEAEFSIPFKTLRFRDDENQSWGVNFDRRIRRKNETAYWSPIPRPFRAYRVSLAGTLHGINGVNQGHNLYLKPYVSAPLLRLEDDDWDFLPDAGLDVKYGVTSELTLDLTVNTDFAQVEADEQQINFTRFSLFFPEKREFFLENSNVFEFGRTRLRGGSGRSRRSGGSRRTRNDLIPFFSRRIGISGGQVIPILGGARLTGRTGRFRLGFISMQQDEFAESPSTNFSVARIRRDVFRSSDFGVLLINKAEDGGYFNRTFGADANFRFFNYLDLSSYLLKTETPGLPNEDMAGIFRAAWRDPFWNFEISHLTIQENFNAEMGFVPRGGYDTEDEHGEHMRKDSIRFGVTPRPESWIRELRPSVQVDYFTDQENVLQTREMMASFSIVFQNSSSISLQRGSTFDRLNKEVEILDEIFPAADYQFEEYSASFSSDRSRLLSAFVRWSDGEFYGGHRNAYTAGGRLALNANFAADLSWSRSNFDFPTNQFATNLANLRVLYSFNTNMFLNALVQYNSRSNQTSSNIRFNLIHKPLSDFFLVYNERRDTQGAIIDRALIAKLTYLFNF